MPDFSLYSPPSLDTATLSVEPGNFRLNYPRNEVPSSVETEIAVTFQAAGRGLTAQAKASALAYLLPNGETRYVGLFEVVPNNAGVGGTEAVGSAYARVAHTAWVNAVPGHVAHRRNVGTIQFPTLTGDLLVRGWGIWDAASGGNLLAFGLLRAAAAGSPVDFELPSGDFPRILDGELIVGIQ